MAVKGFVVAALVASAVAGPVVAGASAPTSTTLDPANPPAVAPVAYYDGPEEDRPRAKKFESKGYSGSGGSRQLLDDFLAERGSKK